MSKPKPKWTFNAEDWPDQRESMYWANLNRGQKAYVIRAYNQARRSRGYAPIPNPFAKDGTPLYQNEDNEETITPKTPGKMKISPINRNAINKFIQAIPPGHRGPLIEAFANATTLSPNEVLMRADPELRDIIENYDFQDFDQAGISGSKKQKTTDTNLKRKTPDTPIEEQETQGKRPPTEADMVNRIPGGAGATEDEIASTGAGRAASSGALAMGTGPITTVHRPMNFANSGGLVFEKVHRVLAYGLASTPIAHPLNTDANTTGPVILMTTSLMEIPWDKPFFYLSPGEFSSLPKGCYVKSVHVEVVQRNPRVAFETASTDSGLATLNQNKFGVKAMGLNTLNGMRVTNRRYSAFATMGEPMIPTSTAVAKYDDIDEAMYGVSQSDTGFNGAIPSSCFMQPILMPNYLTCWNTAYDAGLVATSKATGWYSLAEHVTQFDMNATTGTKIIEASYKPSYAPLTEQTAFAEYLTGQLGTPNAVGPTVSGINFNEFSFTDGNATKQLTRITVNNVNNTIAGNPDEIYSTEPTNRNRFNAEAVTGRLQNFEKGQISKNIDRGQDNKCVQPSLHVGISPVPRLTSSTNLIQPKSWTDVQAYYEIKATMHIGYHFPHHNTHQTEFNIEANDVKMSVDGNVTSGIDYPIRFGHYNQTFPP